MYQRLAPIFQMCRVPGAQKSESVVIYWRAQSYQDRLAALEEIRQEYHRWKDDVQPGLQRVYRIVKRQPG